jgi:hypothetical protein
MRPMMKRALAAALASTIALAIAWPAAAEETPDATIELSAGAFDPGLGYRWSGGTLHYRGASYPLRVSGLTAAGVDVPVHADGAVYHLWTLDDLDGFYSETGPVLRNDHGVVIRLYPAPLGEHVQPSLLGVEISLEREGG